jgi:hypothetical protein
LHNAPERFNPGSRRRQSGVSFDPDFSQFPNDHLEDPDENH